MKGHGVFVLILLSRMGLLLLSLAAVKLDIQPKAVIAFCLYGQQGERI